MSSDDLARRRALLAAALGFALVDTKGKPAQLWVQILVIEAKAARFQALVREAA